MATSGSLGLADSLREQRLLELHKRLTAAANEFPAFTHFALRSDDPLCWKSLHLANCDGLNAQIPALPPARKGWPDPRIRQLKRWEQDFGHGLLSDSERGQLDAGIREWVWERSLTECCRDPNYQGGFMAVGQRLTINGRDWIGRLVDGTVRGMASCKGFHLMRRLAPQLLPDLLGVEQVADLDWDEHERLWMERLYELFPSESRHFGPIEILTLPMNVFATTARLLETETERDRPQLQDDSIPRHIKSETLAVMNRVGFDKPNKVIQPLVRRKKQTVLAAINELRRERQAQGETS